MSINEIIRCLEVMRRDIDNFENEERISSYTKSYLDGRRDGIGCAADILKSLAEGMALVPVEPTEKMILSGNSVSEIEAGCIDISGELPNIYKAMITTAQGVNDNE